jgi:type II secretory pathway pseudopilin PulG
MTIPAAPCTERRQRGVTVIESLIASLLLGIIFIGLAQILTKNLRAQGENYAIGLALFEIRQQLQTPGQGIEDLCAGETPQPLWLDGDIAITAQCSTGPAVTLDLPGIAPSEPVPLRQFTIATESGEDAMLLFGGDGVVSTSTTL